MAQGSVAAQPRATSGGAGPRTIVSIAIASGVILALVPGAWAWTQSGPATGGVLGPYTLDNATQDVGLSFPDCSLVTVGWHVVAGGKANFTVSTGENQIASSCRGPPPTNESCLPTGCAANGPPPVCYESGAAGSCSFTSTQPVYDFGLFTPLSGQGIGNLAVSFTASYAPNPG